MPPSLERLRALSAFSGANAPFIEDLYERYLDAPGSVPRDWRERFDALHREAPEEVPHLPIRRHFQDLAHERPHGGAVWSAAEAGKQAAVLRLINAYRFRGHQQADLDPIRLREPTPVSELDPAFHHLGVEDMERRFDTGSLYAPKRLSLGEIINLLKASYCGHVGSEYMHITDTREKRWIQKRLEGYRGRPELSDDDRRWLLRLLTAAEGIEHYLHTRYVGQKRFSLEGAEALIPLLDELIQRAGRSGMDEIVLGMAHRGRINVLTNILGKPPREIFDEFEGRVNLETLERSGDVKYHLGFSTDIDTPGGPVHLALGFNPSHLEIISPVIEGSVRARQQRRRDRHGERVLPVLVHGDSAFAGQGVVMETFNLSQTRGHATGGSVHIVVNNQIGFTTSNPLDTRSTLYCTDVAKMVQAPIFHVNGDDPEAVIFAVRLALDFRNTFHKDVVLDLVCYRRHGHNEADEPAVTQPLMYRRIRAHPPVRQVYAERLAAQGVVSAEQAAAMVDEYRDAMDAGSVVARPVLCALDHPYRADWGPYQGVPWDQPCDTRLPQERLRALGLELLGLPEGFELHPRVRRIWSERRRMAEGDQLADWGFAETLAYATLVTEGWPVRLCGQDCSRGTFFHRHATVHDQARGESYTPLQHLAPDQAPFVAIDSILSEEAVLAYEYGYASAEPEALTLWEAQFGDFANGAQVVIDQFISSAGSKWGLYCGLVLLLPHGQEGQGPEHSSGRLERFLQLCARHNMQICIPTTPAQIYHLLRRQQLRPYRKPLVAFTPKSLLRHRLATSRLEELAEGRFQEVIPEIDPIDPQRVLRVVLCSGKVYYDLLEARRARGMEEVAILRLEQIYPFPKAAFSAALAPYAGVREIIWCQEEPQNQGAWDQLKHRLVGFLGEDQRLYYTGRPVAAAPAPGYYPLYLKQQKQLVDAALDGRIDPAMNRRMPCK